MDVQAAPPPVSERSRMSASRAFLVGAAIGLPLAGILWLTLTMVGLHGRLDRQTQQTRTLSAQLEELESSVDETDEALASLEDRIDDLSERLSDAIPRIQRAAASRACDAEIAAGPTLPADWTYVCVPESPDGETLGEAITREWLGNNRWAGVIHIYFIDHLAYGEAGSGSFLDELVDTVHHEAHHAWCVRTGGEADHAGIDGEVPLCSISVPIGPPVGDWGGADG